MIIVCITSEDIAAGRAKSITACPQALALQRATGCSQAWIGPFKIAADGGSNGTHDTPRAAVEFIDRFDAGLPVEPHTFILD